MNFFKQLKALFTSTEEKKPPKKAAKRVKRKPPAKIKKKASQKKKIVVKKRAQKKLPKTKKKPLKKRPPKKSNQLPVSPSKEKMIGVVIHYFGKISVGIIKLKSALRAGDKIHIKGAHDNFTQLIKSMQVNHKDITHAKKGDEVGIKVSKAVHENDKVYKLL